MEEELILAINPGSTSTKVAIFKNAKEFFLKTIRHSVEEIERFEKITDQYEFRRNIIIEELQKANIETDKIRVVMGRGGLLKPIKSGIYAVNDQMVEDLRKGIMGEHASNLGGLIARDIARSLPQAKAYIADPVVVDEMEDIARISGHPAIDRVSIFHALNQKAIARQHARAVAQTYEALNLIIAHLGGGISVGAHKRGRVIDVNQALDGDGPFSPERSGGLPVGALTKLCFDGKHHLKDIQAMITGKGGLVAYLGTNDGYEVEKRVAAGDQKAKFIQEAMAYQVAKEIGSMSTVLKGEVDAILLTGGMAYSEPLIELITQRVRHISPVYVYPGEDEMRALAMNGVRILKGEAQAMVYT